MSDNIQVSIRVRPLNPKETLDPQVCRCIQVNQNFNSISIQVNSAVKTFNFDYVADEMTTQEKIFTQVARPITENCLKGYNGTIFSYGQTGSGKTHTIIGHSSSTFTDLQAGVLPRCLYHILEKTTVEVDMRENLEFLVKCSFLEIYNEQIKDLLAEDSRNLQIREDIKKGCYVEDLIEESVFNLDSALECLRRGLQRRHVGSTLMNSNSSRSHSVFSVRVEAKENKADLLTYRNSVFHIIDLAGSERQKPAGTSGDRLREAAMINKSLSNLGDVINSLVEIAEGKSRYVRYRDSRLTFLLKDSIGGNSKTSLIANISPSFSSYAETLSTLRFAERAKLVKNRAVINEDTLETLNELKAENQRLRSLLQNNPESLPLNPRVRELQELLAKNTELRLKTEGSLQEIINEKESLNFELLETQKKYDNKIMSMELVRKLQKDQINSLKAKKNFPENLIIFNLQQENELLLRENQNHPIAAKYFVENDMLKHYVQELKNELKGSPNSITQRLKENQEYTEKFVYQYQECLKDIKVLEDRMEKIINRNKDLEKALSIAEEHKNQLVLDLETLKIRLDCINDHAGQEDHQKTPLKLLDPNINQGRSRSSLSGYQLFPNTSSPFLPFSNQKLNQMRNLDEIDSSDDLRQECIDCQLKDQKISDLEKRMASISSSFEELQYFQEQNFILGEDIKKMDHELTRKEQVINESNEEFQQILAENVALSFQITDLTNQINENSSLIQEFTRNKQLPIHDFQEFSKLKDENSILKNENFKLKTKNLKISQNFVDSVKNHEKTIENLRKTQEHEFSLLKEVDELKAKMKEMQRANNSYLEKLAEADRELIRVNGHQNLNQKINYLSKLKEDYNKLKDQCFRLQEENKTIGNQFAIISRKYERLAKASGNIICFEELEMAKEKIRELEMKISSMDEIFNCTCRNLLNLPFFNEISKFDIHDAVKYVVDRYGSTLSKYEEMIIEHNKEIRKMEAVNSLLEGENKNLKHKIFCMNSE